MPTAISWRRLNSGVGPLMHDTSHLKMIRSISFALLAAAALLGCNDKPGHDGHAERESRSAASAQVDATTADQWRSNASKAYAENQMFAPALPYLTSDGTRFPYFKYALDDSSLWGDSESELAVFVYPIFDIRSKGLALPHMPTQDVAELFGEELFGTSFSVVENGGVLLIDEIPVSRPRDLNAGSKWKMTYLGAAFDCRVTRQTGADFTIRCDSTRIGLNLRFNTDRGFTSYQDYCSKDVCTYNLRSSVGMLSPYHLQLLTEPPPIAQ